MKKIIIGFLIGFFICSGSVFAREKLVNFSKESIPVFNENILRPLWFAIDDLKVRKFDLQTIVDGDVTPSVANGNVFVTSSNSGATAITQYDNARTGQFIIVIGGSNNNSSTMADSGNFRLSGAMTLGLDDTITLYYNGIVWIELARTNN